MRAYLAAYITGTRPGAVLQEWTEDEVDGLIAMHLEQTRKVRR